METLYEICDNKKLPKYPLDEIFINDFKKSGRKSKT